ncbi:arginine deiminase [Salinivirga cyanobacteriivorans]|uniref:arginine deiminase n=1 Tax=Salinivirga cyanobacteriivorans TaxID=1307839 RepID=A0A0S2HXC8_9BACT|nr:arginine deiminase family protein [Salinivirga cyanobacteriivorans]ALO14723.1 Arginine deiminase [Salinivirga cyanobacteriivorans]
MDTYQIRVNSEIGELEGVIVHSPGKEVENMTPKNAERALYSDILNLSVAQKEYGHFKNALAKHAPTFEVRELLQDVLSNQRVKETLIDHIFDNEHTMASRHFLLGLSDEELARQLLEGVILVKDNLTKYFSKERYALRPLHNFFFTRDAAMAVRDKVLIGRMANQVRGREALIMQAIFDYHPMFRTQTVNPVQHATFNDKISIEGGDVLVAREDVLLIGTGTRTSSQGIDFILEQIESKEQVRHIIVQELPETPESFIHLDMVFTFLDKNKCMVFEPIVMKPNRYQTVHITIDNGKVNIKNEKNIVECLNNLGFDLEPVFCGGTKDPWAQEREQWHSGANFFALAPGKVLGYARNVYTMEQMNKHGFEILSAEDVGSGKVDISKYEKYVVAVEGSELPRGGGGARCMTMPFKRKPITW